MPDTTTIVVTAVRKNSDPYSSTYSSAASPRVVTAGTGTGGSGGGGGGTTDVTVASVNVSVSNPANLAKATEAAQNVATAIATIVAALEALPSTTQITLPQPPGTTVTVGVLLAQISNTQIVITDATYSDGGPGQAIRGEDGTPNINYLDFRSFVGPGSYADPGYTNGQALIGIMLHEIGHITSNGVAFRNASAQAFVRANGGSLEGFVGSAHFINAERWANDFLKTSAIVLGLNLTGYNPTFGYGAVPIRNVGR